MFDRYPKKLINTLLLLAHLDIKKEILKAVCYLWDEFSIYIKLKPVIVKLELSIFKRNDELILRRDIKSITEIPKILKQVKKKYSYKKKDIDNKWRKK